MTPAELRTELLDQLGAPFTGEELFDCLGDLVFFMKNLRGEYVVVNQTLVDRCGLRNKSALIGRTPDQLFPHPLGENYRAQDRRVFRTGVPILNQLELHLYPTGGRGWCLTNKLPLRGVDGSVVGLVGISKDLQTPNEKGADFSQVARAIDHIQAHFDQPLKVPALARMAGLSTYQFEQRMRRIFQITPGQFVHKIRMESAVRRLRETGDPIAALAQECGYSDQSAFSRHFKQTVGLSPAQYRRSTRTAGQGG